MPRFRNIAAATLIMQFGHERKIVIEPGESAEVAEKWAGLVIERGYKVERVEDDFGDFVAMAEQLAKPLVPKVAERVDAMLAFIRTAPSLKELERIFDEHQDLKALVTETQLDELQAAAKKRVEELGPPPAPVGPVVPGATVPVTPPATESETAEVGDGDEDAEGEEPVDATSDAPKKPRKPRKKKPEGDGSNAG
jgi:hypothetical protein